MNQWDIDYGKVFECIPRITGLPVQRFRKNWIGKCYINGAPHRHRRDKLVISRDNSGGIVLLEQGGETMQLWKWMKAYGGCSTDKEVGDRLREMSSGTLYIPPPPPDAPAIYVPSSALERAKAQIGVIQDNLYKWLCTKYPPDHVKDTYERYNVTPVLLRDGRIGTQFWYVDYQGHICHDKIIVYQENGRRDKTYGGGRNYLTRDGYSHRCYFGEHLGTDGLIYVVESEKTALLMVLDGSRHTLATGGANNIRRIRANYRLFPDFDDAGMEWVAKFPSQCSRWWEDKEDARPGDDMGDVIHRRLNEWK